MTVKLQIIYLTHESRDFNTNVRHFQVNALPSLLLNVFNCSSMNPYSAKRIHVPPILVE